MSRKWIIASILIVVLIALCGASLFAVWQGTQMMESSGIRFNVATNTVNAEGTEEKTLTVSGPVTLTLNNDFGDVSVTSGEPGNIHIIAEKTAWGSDEADAQKQLENLKIIVGQNGNSINISVQQPNRENVLNIGNGGGSVKFTLTVPEETSLDLHSVNGNLTLSGTAGDAGLQTDFGSIEVSNVSNVVTVKTINGNITATDITSQADLSLTSDFGNISLANSQAPTMEIISINGRITLEDIEVEGKLTAHSDFGDQSLSAVEASIYDLQTQNGRIKLDKARGSITARSDFGDVEVLNVENGTIDLASNNGAITFSGSLAEGPHSIASDFGNINLIIPPETGLNVDLQTEFGKISSDFEITVSGALDDNHWVGKLNGGGEALTVKTNNGNITINSK